MNKFVILKIIVCRFYFVIKYIWIGIFFGIIYKIFKNYLFGCRLYCKLIIVDFK